MLDGRDSKYSSTSESAINVAQRSQLLQEVWFGTFICVNLHIGYCTLIFQSPLVADTLLVQK